MTTSASPNDNKSETETKSKAWLQKLKDESWEAELLVSAIAIFGTFQLFKLIDWATNKFIDYLPQEQYTIAYFIVVFGLLAISLLASMFVIHFLLRSYWIGLVGLNSVFPDYSIKDSTYSKIFTEKILSILPKLKDSITKVDDICSVIFSAAFFLLLVYSYFAISATIYLLLFNLLSEYTILANLKRLKENEKLQLFSFKLLKIGSILSFGPLYKSLLQIRMTFSSNYKKNKSLSRTLLLFICSGLIVVVYQISNNNIRYLIRNDYFFNATKTYAGYYKSENENIDFLLAPEISSDIIEQKVIKLFIPIFEHEDKLRINKCNTYKNDDSLSFEENRLKTKINFLNCYHQYHEVYINNQKFQPRFKKYKHPRTDQFGILTYINIQNISDGENTLTVKKVYSKEKQTEWNIPFYYILKK